MTLSVFGLALLVCVLLLIAGGYRIALLINFGGDQIEPRRFLNDRGKYLSFPR